MKPLSKAALGGLVVVLGLSGIQLSGGNGSKSGALSFVSNAEARVGRPLARVHVGGVAHRTTRRVIRRGAYIAILPARCTYGTYYGYSLYYCGGTYYQRSGGGYIIVTF